ncbi:hypothetical protein CsatB_008379 [Cannabis sativa]|uniref:Uncharacterized protein n=1 Tax=Cannabis sativa TaxID=3483 RepID=A0A803QWJ4_CANSA
METTLRADLDSDDVANESGMLTTYEREFLEHCICDISERHRLPLLCRLSPLLLGKHCAFDGFRVEDSRKDGLSYGGSI